MTTPPTPPKKPSKLKGRDPTTVEPSKPKIIVYGPPGVGKTWAAIEFPDVFYIDTEGGADLDHYRKKLRDARALYMGPEDGSLDFSSVIEQVQALATEQHDRKTLVIDSFSKLFNNQITMTQEKMAKAGTEDAFGASKKEAIQYTRRLIAWMNKLDMNVILIHHQKSSWKDGKEVGVTFDGWDKLEYELHLALRVAKNGPSRLAYVGKSRLEQFPSDSNFPWSFQEFSTRWGLDTINAAAKPASVATAEQMVAYKTLLSQVKIDPAVSDKWAAAGDPDLLTEDAMAKRLDWLRRQAAAAQP
jgi:hypothetical protein